MRPLTGAIDGASAFTYTEPKRLQRVENEEKGSSGRSATRRCQRRSKFETVVRE